MTQGGGAAFLEELSQPRWGTGCEAPEGAQVPPSALITRRLHPTPKPLIQPQTPGKPSQQQGQGPPAGGSQRLRGSPEAEVSWFEFCLQLSPAADPGRWVRGGGVNRDREGGDGRVPR